MKEIKLYKSKKKAIQMMLLCTPFVLIGIWMIPEKPILGWLSIALFGLAYPFGIFNLFDKKPIIIINEIGIYDRSTNTDFINWELIQDAYPLDINGQKFVCLVIDEKYKPSNNKSSLYKNAVKLNEAIGAQELNIHLGQIQKIDEVKLTQFILEMSKANKTTKAEMIKMLPKNKQFL
ncbi:STM3941 family protein [Tenacibaculum sp. IB213877]|uniref:STM3941 family protein n=1 Tax=Tenacibaculum sp. IB213877 TaxID=3097351 RepID=UPI002A5AE29A|nr:STM3941 family protein [Tenacibaculum sp. IB213877]MDY0780782.1 STM3941 family protein [Tenacibaculum sp. IB213877]